MESRRDQHSIVTCDAIVTFDDIQTQGSNYHAMRGHTCDANIHLTTVTFDVLVAYDAIVTWPDIVILPW